MRVRYGLKSHRGVLFKEFIMSHFLSFTVHELPCGKDRPRFSMSGGYPHVYTSEKTRRFETIFSDVAHGAMMRAGLVPTYDAVRLHIVAYFPVPQSYSKKKRGECISGVIKPMMKPDIDNVIKAALDAMNDVVYDDDKQVFELVVSKRYTESCEGYIEVEVEVE